MRHMLILLLAVLFASAFASAQRLVYNQWHHSGDTFKINVEGYEEDIHYISYYIYGEEHNSRDRMLYKINNKGFTLRQGECRIEPLIMYCLDTVDWKDKGDNGNLEYRHGKQYPGLNIKVYLVGPDMVVTRTSEAGTTLNIEQESRISIKLENRGNRRAESVLYQEKPPGIIESYSPSMIDSRILEDQLIYQWQGFFIEGDIKGMSYRIKPVSYDDFKIPATMEYSYQGKTYTKNIADLSFSVKTPYAFAVGLQPSKVGLSEPSILTIRFGNEDKYRDVSASVKIFIPKELEIISVPTMLQRRADYYELTRKFKPGNDYSFEVAIRGGATGKYQITVLASYDFGAGDVMNARADKDFEISASRLNPRLRIIDNSVEGGTVVRAVAEIENKDKTNTFVQIQGTLLSPLLEKPIEISAKEMPPGRLEKFVDDKITTPVTNTVREYNFQFKGTYKLLSGEAFDFDTHAILTVNPTGGDYLQITHDIGGGLVVKGEDITVKTTIKNLKGFPLRGIDVSEIIPEGLSIVGGHTKNIIDLEKTETRQAYLYRIKVPETFQGEQFNIKTTARYQEYPFEQASTIRVLTPTPQETPEIEQPAEQIEEEMIEEPEKTVEKQEKKGFFARLFENISSFLSKIF